MRRRTIPLLVYTAGPFSAPTREGVEANIRAAVDLAVEVAKLGALPVCPHSSTADPRFEHVQPYQFWLDGTLELLRRCDAVILTPDWQRSTGARAEVAEARRIGMPVFSSLAELSAWLGVPSLRESSGAP